MMNRWKHTMITTATSVTHLFVENSRVSGARISTTLPGPCAMNDGEV